MKCESRIVVTGGAGFLGSRVIRELLRQIDMGAAPLGAERIVSLDLAPCPVVDERVESLVGNMTDDALVSQAITLNTVGVFHLAAVLSGGSAENFDLAYQVNVDGTRILLEAARAIGNRPNFVFTSSLAVFGGELPDSVPEQWAAQPDSTYGAFKAVGELLVNEYSRKGYVDARICRLPTISVRPGRPNSAASSFASGIIREPLAGEASECPVPHSTRMWLSSPDTAVRNLTRALTVSGNEIGSWRAMNIPGISVSVAEMLASLQRVAGQGVRDLVKDRPDPAVMEIVCSWPGEFNVERLLALGFERDESFDAVVLQYQREFGGGRASGD